MRIWSALLLSLAGLCGAAGVGLAAVATHRALGPNATTAAQFLLIHAAALAGLAVGGASASRGQLFAASLLGLGVVLFAGDLALLALVGSSPWRMAAPTGGTLMILGWLVLALVGLARLRR
jgi:uncharacterized membrane protein YgdD (TMEM256/DUF423 family)